MISFSEFKNGNKRSFKCVVDKWDPNWNFGRFSVYALADDDASASKGKRTFVKTIIRSSNLEQGVELGEDLYGSLSPGLYRFAVFYESEGIEIMLDDGQLSGRQFKIPYNCRVFYCIDDKTREDWNRVHVLVDGEIPSDALHVRWAKAEYPLPISPENGREYTFLIRKIAGKEDITIVSNVEISGTILKTTQEEIHTRSKGTKA